MASGTDRISALPEEVPLHVLSFLPADEAVRTSVLARRWRHLWRSTPRLRITRCGRFETTVEMDKFVNSLLLLRDHTSALDECQLSVDHFLRNIGGKGHFYFCFDLWARQALQYQVRVLRLHVYRYSRLTLTDEPLISQHLTRLELENVGLMGRFLDFSSCPVLQELKMRNCDFGCSDDTRMSAPTLQLLEIAGSSGSFPLLESMPSLATSFVRLGEGNFEDHNRLPHGSDTPSRILKGLSNATNLELTTEADTMVVLKSDLRRCPTFSKLKTLLLNEWCVITKSGALGSVALETGALVCLLQHSPVLEKLTLQLCELEGTLKAEKMCGLREHCFASKHLKSVEVKCYKIDEWSDEILKVLSTCGVPPECIIFQQTKLWSSGNLTLDNSHSYISAIFMNVYMVAMKNVNLIR